jgi:glycosyltransferase involved in cell wall biosynthesis
VVVNTCHGLWVTPEDTWKKKAFVLGAEGFAGRFSHAELYQNDADRIRMAPYLKGHLKGRTQQTVGNGIDLDRFTPDPNERARVRAELGVGDDDVLVGGVGRLVEEKGILEYVEAARQLEGRATFVWVGPSDADKPDALDVQGGPVRFLGPRTDMPAVYVALDVFVLPSYREGFSRSGMEAAASGVASVLSDIRGCREVGEHEGSLLLVPPADPVALAEAVGRLVADPALRARLAAAAQVRAKERFDQRVVASRSLATYTAVARRRGLGWT